MKGGLEVTVGGDLQQLTDVYDKCAGHGRCINPDTIFFDLQPAFTFLNVQQGQHSEVFMRANTLSCNVARFSGIAHNFDER